MWIENLNLHEWGGGGACFALLTNYSAFTCGDLYHSISNPHLLPVQSAPACVSGLTFVDRNTGERMNKSLITGNAIITFTTEQLRRNRYYDVTVNAINVESSATIISTHGIENATYQMETNGTRVETDYFRNSSAIGALYIFICNGSKNMNFSYQAFNRDKSPDHILLVPNLALAYDIESDGTLYDGDGVSFPASVSSIPITGNCNGKMCVCVQYIRSNCQSYKCVCVCVEGGLMLCTSPW